MTTWAAYKSHRVVKVAKIASVSPKTGDTVNAMLVLEGGEVFYPTVADMAGKASAGDYAMLYEDGYKSVCSKKSFEDNYTEIKE